MGPVAGWADLGAVSLRYEYRPGAGPLVVLVHELGGALESWDGVVAALAPDIPVLRLDTRGAGLSEKLVSAPSMAQCAADIAALLRHLGHGAPVVLAGCAVGGGIALRHAIDHPTATAAVVAINPAVDVTPAGGAALVALAGTLREAGLRPVEGPALNAPYPERYRARNPAGFARFRARWLTNDPVSLGWLCRMLAETDLKPQLGEIACPVTLVAGLHDTLRPPAYVRALADRIGSARVIEIDSGHHAPDHAPEAVARAIEATVARVMQPDPAVRGEGMK